MPVANGCQIYLSSAFALLGWSWLIFDSIWGKTSSILFVFHSISEVRRSATVRYRSCSKAGPHGFIFSLREIQESYQTFVFSPLPMTLAIPSLSRFLPCRILFQPCEHDVVTCTFRNDSLWQYLPINTLARRQLGVVRILQACLAKRAWLKSCMSRIPSPSLAFGFVNFCQDTQHIFLFSSDVCHQYLVNADCIRLQILTGGWKHDIEYVGMAVRTALRRVSLPALDRNRDDREAALCLIMSTSELKRSRFLLSKCSGNPIYLPVPPSVEIPSSSLILPLEFLKRRR